MKTPTWIDYLRTNAEAWNNYLEWLGELRQIVLERDPATWEAEKERQGAKKELDNLLHLSTIDQKNEVQRVAYLKGK